jgi:hypothetical protein
MIIISDHQISISLLLALVLESLAAEDLSQIIFSLYIMDFILRASTTTDKTSSRQEFFE